MDLKFEDNHIALAMELISKYNICLECLGRQFALVGTGFKNSERAEKLLDMIIDKIDVEIGEVVGKDVQMFQQKISDLINAYNHNNYPKLKLLLEKHGISAEKSSDSCENPVCYFCDNNFSMIDVISKDIVEKTKEYEFKNFLIGTVVLASIQNNEDEVRAKLKITTGESFKKNLNRVLGVQLSSLLNVPAEFLEPELQINIRLMPDGYEILIQANPLCIQGRYHKYIRGIPQTHWPHRECRGRGCEKCNFTGKQWETSVEELLSPPFLRDSQGTDSVFHGSGREDIDVRCLGTGRPFIIEIKHPKKRKLDLKKIEDEIKNTVGDKVDAIDLEIVPRSRVEIIKGKGEDVHKIYDALVEAEQDITDQQFDEKMKEFQSKIVGKIIYQRTPERVAHRRADLTREKSVYSIQGVKESNRLMRFKIDAMGGTYIKELISGDKGRTNPSFTDIFGVQLVCKELDVIAVEKF